MYNDMTNHTISNAYMKSEMSVNAIQKTMAPCTCSDIVLLFFC